VVRSEIYQRRVACFFIEEPMWHTSRGARSARRRWRGNDWRVPRMQALRASVMQQPEGGVACRKLYLASGAGQHESSLAIK